MTGDPRRADETDPAALRDRALVAFLLSTGSRISEALALQRADWNTSSVIVRGEGDVERSVVVTDRARTQVDAELWADDQGAALSVVTPPPDRAATLGPRHRVRVRSARAAR